MPVKSRHLVIDASVARSSGGEDATYPTSKNCRDFLKAVLEVCHCVVMTPEIKEEWDKHQSGFARKWRVTMVSRKKLVYCSDIQINNKLWETIEMIAGSDKEREQLFKDLRLIEAAIATDKTVISLDETVRKLFDKVATQVTELRNIVWVNPDKAEEKPVEWLENGAKSESDRWLGNLP